METKVHRYPHPVLRQVATKIDILDLEKGVIEELEYAFEKSGGLALAHSQISSHPRRVFIVSQDLMCPVLPRIVVNPVITYVSPNEMITENEGCLSLPGVQVPVPRHPFIGVEFYDRWGNEHHQEFKDLVARMFQHEVDHLDGKLIVDHLDKRKKFEIRSLMLKRR